MRNTPTQTYGGYTVILSEPSRFVTESGRLISGNTADWFEESCLPPGISLSNIEVRDLSSISAPFLPGTKYISVHGKKAAEYFHTDLNRHGYQFVINNTIPAVVAFDPHDCNDHKDMRDDEDEDDENAVSERDVKDAAPTRLKNWRYWTAWHIRKLLTQRPAALAPINIKIYPRLSEACAVLDAATNEDLYLDIETSRLHGSLGCIGFSTTSSFPNVYVVPVYRYDGSLAYSEFHRFHRSLSRAFLRNKVVAHNGAGFDFFVLRAYYKFPLPRDPYDTMLAHHRIHPELEKSISHAMCMWTHLPYHKDQNVEPRNSAQEQQQHVYNARDVYALKPIKDAQFAYAAGDKGLVDSIVQAHAWIVLYLTTTLTGLRLDIFKLSEVARKLELKKSVYQRIASMLAGRPFNPASSDQCRKYLHDTLNYAVVGRTETGKPKLGSKQLYQLHLKYNNPLIPVILKYREAHKDHSNL